MLIGLRKITLPLLKYQSKYSSAEVEEVVENGGFNMRNMRDKIKNALIYDQDILDKRWEICKGCEFLTTNERMGKTYNRCEQCGCFMKIGDTFIKIRVGTASCPVGKWDVEYKTLPPNKPIKVLPEPENTIQPIVE